MRSAEDIYKILTSQKTNYVIIEESICNELRLDKGCRIKDLLDISNGHVSLDTLSLAACCSFSSECVCHVTLEVLQGETSQASLLQSVELRLINMWM